jgi:hypothetical protein
VSNDNYVPSSDIGAEIALRIMGRRVSKNNYLHIPLQVLSEPEVRYRLSTNYYSTDEWVGVKPISMTMRPPCSGLGSLSSLSKNSKPISLFIFKLPLSMRINALADHGCLTATNKENVQKYIL